MRSDDFKLNVDPVRTEMTGTQQIMISHIFDLEKSESKEILADENLLQVFSMDEVNPESIIAD